MYGFFSSIPNSLGVDMRASHSGCGNSVGAAATGCDQNSSHPTRPKGSHRCRYVLMAPPRARPLATSVCNRGLASATPSHRAVFMPGPRRGKEGRERTCLRPDSPAYQTAGIAAHPSSRLAAAVGWNCSGVFGRKPTKKKKSSNTLTIPSPSRMRPMQPDASLIPLISA